MIKDILKDLVDHFIPVGIDTIKVTGTDTETDICGTDPDMCNHVIVNAKIKKPMLQFEGLFGIPNLTQLKFILGIKEYDGDSTLTVSKKELTGKPKEFQSFNFANKKGDFNHTFRLLSSTIAGELIKTVKPLRPEIVRNITLVPTTQNIMKFRNMAASLPTETYFYIESKDGDLIFTFGDHSNHAGSFVFAEDVPAANLSTICFPVEAFSNILGMVGDKVIKICGVGAMEIEVDSGLINYCFMLPALSK